VRLEGGEDRTVQLRVRVGRVPTVRARVAVDTTIGELMLGQHAEALVDVG
jgi:hypothetical protein